MCLFGSEGSGDQVLLVDCLLGFGVGFFRFFGGGFCVSFVFCFLWVFCLFFNSSSFLTTST